ncbi:EpsI family protein [Desulfococcaceae bacterium HSG8]|nr:EpsI family protein [Desulfococcaceae bacterium HSG8]
MSLKHTLIASFIMILSALFLGYITRAEDIRSNKSFSTFPKQIHEWKGKQEYLSENINEVLGVDDYFLCNYRNPRGSWMNLYIGFYQSQREGDLIHSPKNCMPGSGWNIIRTSIEEIETDGGSYPGKIKAIKLVTQKGRQKQITLYWFQSRGRIISSEYMQKIWLVIDSVTRHRTDGSFVRLITPVTGEEDEDAALNRVKSFAERVMPLLFEYIPS